MKCPKCKFISFDYNDTCPKCERNIATERARMHHADFKPETPFLLGSLLGAGAESHISLETLESETAGDSGEIMLRPDLISTAPPPEIEPQESGPIETAAVEELTPIEDTDVSLELEELAFEKEEPSEEEDFVEVSTAAEEPEELIVSESSPLDEETLSIELDDLLQAESESREEYTDEEALTLEVEALMPSSQDIAEPPATPETTPEPEAVSEGLDMALSEDIPDLPHEQEFTLEPEPVSDIPDMAPIETPETVPETPDVGPMEEPSEPFADIPDMAPLETPEEALSGFEADTDLPSLAERDELFSLDSLKGYKMEDYVVPSKIKSGSVPAKDAPPTSDQKIRGTSEVWDEISKDLEELDFDIDETS